MTNSDQIFFFINYAFSTHVFFDRVFIYILLYLYQHVYNKRIYKFEDVCTFIVKWAILPLIVERTCYLLMGCWSYLFCTRPTRLVNFFIVLVHWNSSSWVAMTFQWDALSWIRANASLLLLLNAVCLWGEA